MSQGVFIVIDGSDGSGKGTQHELLKTRLAYENIPFAQWDFPQYGQPSASFVERYLNGQYGGIDDVPPERAAMFYAMDRYEASFGIRQALAEGKVVLANRFTAASLAHQGAKLKTATERQALFADIEALEHERLNIPRPDCNIILSVPANIGQANIAKKARRAYLGDKKRDIHEEDLDFLRRSVEVYDELCEQFPKSYIRINCMQNTQIMHSPEAIHNTIWHIVTQKLGEAYATIS